MEDILCDISAFRFHRTPPQVLMLCPPYPDRATDNNRAGFRSHILTHEILGTPVHLLATDRKRRLNNVSTVSHLVTNELPFGCIQQTDLGISTASPLYSLFNLASHVDENHLVMAMYEFCGTFSIFRPSPVAEALLDSINSSELLPRSFGWRRVKSSSGRKTDLWRREPLIELGELGQFADAMKSERGGRRFARAAKRVTGVTASPFEVQASMLFSTQRCKGGEGFSGFVNNERIPLSTSARRIYGKSTCCSTFPTAQARLSSNAREKWSTTTMIRRFRIPTGRPRFNKWALLSCRLLIGRYPIGQTLIRCAGWLQGKSESRIEAKTLKRFVARST